MLNWRSPIIQQQFGNPYEFQQQVNNFKQQCCGNQNYNNYQPQQYGNPYNNFQQQQPYYYMAPGYNSNYSAGYYNQQYQQYNPMFVRQQYEEERKRQEEARRQELNFYRRLEEISLNYLGVEVDEEYLDSKYDPDYQAKMQQQMRPLKKKCAYTVCCYMGDEEIYSYNTEEEYDLGENFGEDNYRSYYDAVKPTFERVLQLEKLNKATENYVNPNYIKQLNKIKEDRDKLIDPNSDMADFFANAYKLYIEALEMDVAKQQNQLNTLFNEDNFRRSLLNQKMGYSGEIDFNKVFNSTNLDDHVVGLPDRLKNEYTARKRAFIEKCVERCTGGANYG